MTELEIQQNKEKFMALCRQYIHREGIEELLSYLETKTDFFTAPSSTKFHLNTPGGLCQHSLNVFEAAMKINAALLLPKQEAGECLFPEPLKEESIAVAALFHDLCKCGLYHQTEKWKKDENNKWVSYIGYEVKDEFPFGHGEKSCYIINFYLKLRKEELLAIRWHMGMYDVSEGGSAGRYAFYNSCDISPLVLLMQMADMSSSHWFEETTVY